MFEVNVEVKVRDVTDRPSQVEVTIAGHGVVKLQQALEAEHPLRGDVTTVVHQHEVGALIDELMYAGAGLAIDGEAYLVKIKVVTAYTGVWVYAED